MHRHSSPSDLGAFIFMAIMFIWFGAMALIAYLLNERDG